MTSGLQNISASATRSKESNRGTASSEFTTPDRESRSLTSHRVSSTDCSYGIEHGKITLIENKDIVTHLKMSINSSVPKPSLHT